MSNVISTVAALQTLALTKGPGRGAAAPQSAANVKFLSDSASVPVGAPAVLNTEYIGFGKVPKGAVINRLLSGLVSNHTATIAGKLQLVPLDGSAVQEITGVVINLEATTANSLPLGADDLTVAKDSWVRFVPTASLTIASTAKTVWLRLGYGQTY